MAPFSLPCLFPGVGSGLKETRQHSSFYTPCPRLKYKLLARAALAPADPPRLTSTLSPAKAPEAPCSLAPTLKDLHIALFPPEKLLSFIV